MNTDFLTSLEQVCWVLGMLSAIIAAWFKLRSTWLSNQEDRESLQAKYRSRWEKLREGRYLDLPERGVRWLLGIKGRPSQLLTTFLKWLGGVVDDPKRIIGPMLFLPGAIVIWVLYGPTLGVLACFVTVVFSVIISTDMDVPGWAGKALILFTGGYVLASCFFMLKLALSLTIYWTALLLLVAMPFYVLMVFVVVLTFGSFTAILPVGIRLSSSPDKAWDIGTAFTLSFSITAIALLIGSVCSPNAYVPQTLQMFLVNVLFDGTTLLLTFIILERAIDSGIHESPQQSQGKRKYAIPVAITIDVVVAAVLACLSLYYGLLGSPNALSFTETLNVLMARSASGSTYEMGPYFWAMHTTFIPTALYMVIIMLAYVGKLIILPIFHVLKKGQDFEKPHDLSAAVFAFVAVLFLAFAGLLSRIAPEQAA